jgi:hypothetical protein
MCKEFEVERDVCEADVTRLLVELQSAGLVDVRNAELRLRSTTSRACRSSASICSSSRSRPQTRCTEKTGTFEARA